MEVLLEFVISHLSVEATHEICSAYSTCVIPIVSHKTGYDVLIPKDFDIYNIDIVVDYIVNMVSKETSSPRIKFIVADVDHNDKWEKSILRYKKKTLRDLIKEEDARLYAKL